MYFSIMLNIYLGIIHSNGYGELKNEEEFEITGDNYG